MLDADQYLLNESPRLLDLVIEGVNYSVRRGTGFPLTRTDTLNQLSRIVKAMRVLKSLLLIATTLLLGSCTSEEAYVVGSAAGIAIAVSDFSDSASRDPEIGPICSSDVSGEWRGETSNGGVILLTLEQNNACAITGVASFGSCLPATDVTGMAEIFAQNFSVETADGSLFVRRLENIDADTKSIVDKSSYRFRNTQDRPGCPESESGSIRLTKTV